MTPRAAAAIGLRIIGVWLLLEATFGLVSLFFVHRLLMAGAPGVHRRYYDGSSGVTPSADLYPHDTYYITSNFMPGLTFLPGLTGVAVRLAGGLVLLLASKTLGSIVARKLDTF